MDPKPTVHVIDDDAAMRDSLAFLLDVNGFQARVYDSATAFLDGLSATVAGCVITDIRMPGMSGLELVRKLKTDGVQCPMIVMTGHGDVALAVDAMKAGVVDFIEKPFSNEALLDAVRAALAAVGADLDEPDPAQAEAAVKLSTLSPRERDVLVGVVAGKANKAIAFELGISARTVEIYRANLMSKVGARNVSQLMRIALAAGL